MSGLRIVVALVISLGLGACSSLPPIPGMPSNAGPPTPMADAESSPSVTPPELGARERVSLAVDLLAAGKPDDARLQLDSALVKSPKDATALLLKKQLDEDPEVLLGAASEDYVVQAGDTMSGLAQRYAGDPMMFYALARYNGLVAANALSVGKKLRVPTTFKRSASASKPPTVAAGSAQRADTVRLQALQHLNTGDVSRAVALLKEAQSLDSGNAAIKRDLERALRIQDALDQG